MANRGRDRVPARSCPCGVPAWDMRHADTCQHKRRTHREVWADRMRARFEEVDLDELADGIGLAVQDWESGRLREALARVESAMEAMGAQEELRKAA